MLYFINSQYGGYEHFVLDSIKMPHKVLVIPNALKSLFRRVAHLGWRFHLYFKWNLYGDTFYKEIKVIKEEDIVVFFMVENKEPVLNIIKWLHPNTQKYMWLWNTITGLGDKDANFIKDINIYKSFSIKIATFDRQDSISYHLNFIPQFFNGALKTDYKSDAPLVDFFFGGMTRDNSRIKKINEIKPILLNFGFICDFLIVDYNFSGYISYEEILQRNLQSRCIIDIPRSIQSGLSLRPLEALFLKKKLLTTNKYILEYDFYRKANIFVWGIDNTDDLSDWLNSPYEDVPDSIKQEYDCNVWLNKLLEQ